jgi:long-chain fatty acid transport protein
MRRWTLLSLLNILLVVRPHVSAANPLETYGFGSRAISMGGAYTAVSDDFSAVYYNPAGLPQIGQVNMGVGMTFFSARFKAIQNVVVGETPDGEPVIGDVDTSNSDNGGFMGGVAVRITKRLAMGVGMYLPSNQYLAKLETQNQREPNYIFYDKRNRRMGILASAGVKVLKGLYIGGGADILFGPLGRVKVNVPLGGEGTVDLSLMFRPRISPYGGLLYKIRDDMSIGVVYREKRDQGEADINIGADIDINQLVIPIRGKMHTMIFYSPREATLGWAWKPGQRFLVSLDLTWLKWSAYEDATMEMVVKVGPTNVPFQKVLDPGFHDTFLPRVGIEYLLKTWSMFPVADVVELKLRGGYYFVNSPVPEQKGITNYLDSDSHVFSTGLGLALLSFFGTDRALKLDLYFQVHHLVDRENKKDMEMADLDGDGIPETRVIGYPGYVTGGHIIAGGFTVGVSF